MEELEHACGAWFSTIADAVDSKGYVVVKITEEDGGFDADCGDFGFGLYDDSLAGSANGTPVVLLTSWLCHDRYESHGSNYSIQLVNGKFEDAEYSIKVSRMMDS